MADALSDRTAVAAKAAPGPAATEDEPPLDPVLLKVQARLRRLMLIGGLTLGVGLLAVLLAIVYRIAVMDTTGGTDPSAGAPAVPNDLGIRADLTLSATALGLAPGARLVGTALDGDRLALTFADAGETVVVVVDGDGRVLRRLRLGVPGE